MLNKGKKILKKYPVFIGIFGIMFLMVGLAAYWYHDRMREIVPTVETEDLKREENIERLEKPEQAIKYLIGAIKNQDVDQAMRVFPIDELCLGTNSDKIVEERKEFYSGMLEAPAKEDAAYLPLASSEYTAKYLSVYEKILKSIPGIQEAEIKKIEYMKPEQQLSSEYQIEIEEKCEIYEANAFCDMEVFIEAGMQRYRIPITLVNYDGYWKIFAINGDGNVNDKEVFLFTGEISDVPNADSEKLEKKLQRKIENKEKKEKSEEKKREKNTDILLDEGNGMLPANYVIVNRTFAQNPEMVMKTFIRYTQKKNLAAVLTLGNIDNEKQTPERTTAEQLKNQSLFVEKLKYFYFSILLGEDTAENKTLLDFELSGQELLRKLDTRYFFYLDLKEIIPINEEEYYVFFKYEGEYFRYQFTFTESESGWQIEDISDMKKYSEKKYLQEIENLAGEN